MQHVMVPYHKNLRPSIACGSLAILKSVLPRFWIFPDLGVVKLPDHKHTTFHYFKVTDSQSLFLLLSIGSTIDAPLAL